MPSTAVLSTPIFRRGPVARAVALWRGKYQEQPVVFAEGGVRASVMIGPTGGSAVAGVLTGGTLFQGTSFTDMASTRVLAMPGSTGVPTDMLSNVYSHQVLASLQYGITKTLGGSTIQFRGPSAIVNGVANDQVAGDYCIGFETNAQVFGVAVYGSGATVNIEVLVDLLDGNGLRPIVDRQPEVNVPGSTTATGWAYVRFASSATRRVVIRTTTVGALVIGAADTIVPYNFNKAMLRVAQACDSIYLPAKYAAKKFPTSTHVDISCGGGGYAQPGAQGIGSLAGNTGTLGAGGVQFGRTDFTDRLNAFPCDVLIMTAGRNESYPTSSGFNTLAGYLETIRRVRVGNPDALIVIQTPHSGSNRGADGKQQGDGSEGNAASNIGSFYAAIFGGGATVAGPVVWVNNLESSWRVKRADGSTASGATDTAGQAWQRGNGGFYQGGAPILTDPANGTNSYCVNGDATHPADWVNKATTAGPVTVASTFTLTLGVPNSQFYPASSTVSILDAAKPQQSYGDSTEVRAKVTGRDDTAGTVAFQLAADSPRTSGTIPSGSIVYTRDIVLPGVDSPGTARSGNDFLACKLARCIRDALAAY